MERSYWEKMAPAYNDEIFDVLKNDEKGIIRSTIEQYASPKATIADIGCAIGKWFPVISPAFKKVFALDISAKNLAIAQKNYPHFTNITYVQADMSSTVIKLPKTELVICINAILSGSLKKRNTFFNNLAVSVKKGGHLILVAPSLESWLMARIFQNRWKIDEKLYRDKISGKEGLKKYKNILQGNAELDNVPTKHYLKEELSLLLAQQGFSITDTQKIAYKWNTEFIKAPVWLQEPYPWDWMIVAQKIK